MSELTEAQQSVRAYIALLGTLGYNDGDLAWLEADGQWWQPQVLPKEYTYDPLRECSRNAGRLALQEGWDGTLRYVEGFATTGILPVHHAWCVTEEGKVIDTTWRTRGRSKYKADVSKMAYFGVVLTNKELIKLMQRSLTWGVLFNPYIRRAQLHEEGT